MDQYRPRVGDRPHPESAPAKPSAVRGQSDELQRALEAHRTLRRDLTAQILNEEQSLGGQFLYRARIALSRACPEGTTRASVFRLLREAMRVWMLDGTHLLLARLGIRLGDVLRGRRQLRDLLVIGHRERPVGIDLETQYQQWLSRHSMTPDQESRIRSDIARFSYTPLISFVMSACAPQETLQPLALDAVQAQLYGRWQLCIVYDPSRSPQWSSLFEMRAAADPRIRLIRQRGSSGIAEACNDALALADGEFVALLRPEDAVAPHALYEVVRRLNDNPSLDMLYSDEDRLDAQGHRHAPFFKPDWSPDLLLSTDYVCRLCVLRRSAVMEAGGFRPGFDRSEEYDLVLRVTERISRIAHIPGVLYSVAAGPAPAAGGVALGSEARRTALEVLRQALERRGTPGEVREILPGLYTRRLHVTSHPRVSIIIPTRDRAALLWMCVESITRMTMYPDLEFVLVDNRTRDPRALAYLHALAHDHTVVRDPSEFNFSRLSNRGAGQATGQLLLFLNNDVEAIQPGWLTALVEQALRPDVGAVGCRLVFPDDRTQHAGVVVGLGGTAGHPFHGMTPDTPGYMGLDRVVRNCSAVTGACLMMRRATFLEVGGFDERYRIVLGDVDLCLRLRELGYLVVYTPEATMIHHESASRGHKGPVEDIRVFQAKWRDRLAQGDPYYHPEFSLAEHGYQLET